MKKIFFTILMCLPFAMFAQQADTYGKGIWNVYVGAGFPNTTHTAIDAGSSILNIDGDNSGSSTPFYMASINYGILENIDLGLFGGYFESDSEILAAGSTLIDLLGGGKSTIGSTKYTVFSLGGKATVHEPIFGDIEKLDTYASTYLGYNFVNDDISIDVGENDTVQLPLLGEVNLSNAATEVASNVNYPKFTYEVNVGAKYALTDALNVYGEAGYGRFLVNAGLTYTLN